MENEKVTWLSVQGYIIELVRKRADLIVVNHFGPIVKIN